MYRATWSYIPHLNDSILKSTSVFKDWLDCIDAGSSKINTFQMTKMSSSDYMILSTPIEQFLVEVVEEDYLNKFWQVLGEGQTYPMIAMGGIAIKIANELNITTNVYDTTYVNNNVLTKEGYFHKGDSKTEAINYIVTEKSLCTNYKHLAVRTNHVGLMARDLDGNIQTEILYIEDYNLFLLGTQLFPAETESSSNSKSYRKFIGTYLYYHWIYPLIDLNKQKTPLYLNSYD